MRRRDPATRSPEDRVTDKPNLIDKTCNSRVWITPERILGPVREYFAPRGIELDPATEPNNPTGASQFFTPREDGLSKRWAGNVYLNPPYGREIREWAEKLHREAEAGAHVVALLPPTRTETQYWQDHILIPQLTGVCYVRKRVSFLRTDGTPAKNNTYSSILLVYNGDWRRLGECFGELGKCMKNGGIL